jgi:glucosylglycerate hydrolase
MAIDLTNPLAMRAVEILRQNDTGSSTKPAPSLYPHVWSWDSAFIAIGIAQYSVERAVEEMRSLFRGQWKNGMIPHIQYHPDVPADAYFPDAARWDVRAVSPDAPAGIETSGIIQPPVHAIAVRSICDQADRHQARAIAKEFYAPLREWHRYLMSARDPEISGLVTIVHPWESGMDNSPRWDAAMARIQVPEGEMPPFTRRDLAHVADSSQRPTDEDYNRYIWILEVLKRGNYRVDRIYDDLPFRVKDVYTTALLVAANESLIQIANLADVDFDELNLIDAWINRGRIGLAEQWDDANGLCCDLDLVHNAIIPVQTIAAFAPVIAGQVTPARRKMLTELWRSRAFVGNEDLRWAVPPSTSPLDPAFNPRRYWRGPVWPIMNWLLWWAWGRIGEFGIADDLREDGLKQVAQIGFYEYMDPFTGDGLGSDAQSWTAAAVLDWLADS